MVSVEAEDIIWGISRKEDSLLDSSVLSEDIDVPIEQELLTFLCEQIKKFSPDRIIVVERKGTAILRALKDLDNHSLDWPWEKVISSAVIEQAPDHFFKDCRILIFDDMLRTGWHIWNELIGKLKKRKFWNSIKGKIFIASFAIHSQYKEVANEGFPHAWFYRNLDSKGYNYLRNRIVSMLQKAGSLMLDTEHIEVRVQVKCDVRTFFETLARKAKMINFHSSGNRLNATIYYSDDPLYSLPHDILPPDSKTERIVKKCRIIRRKGNEFAIIPLCYPSTPATLDSSWPPSEKQKEILCSPDLETPEGRFYDVALLSAVEVLKWVLTDLFTLAPEKYRLELPSPSCAEEPMKGDSYTLSHLKVMYPSLNIEKLTKYIHMKADEARTKAVKLRSRKLSRENIEPLTDEQLKGWAIRLCELIRNALDEKIAIDFLEGMSDKPHPYGMTAEEIFRLGKSMGLPDQVTSILFDILIDNAYLVTHVQILQDDKGVTRAVRTFEPDGEVVSDRIRKYSLMWGLSNEFRGA